MNAFVVGERKEEFKAQNAPEVHYNRKHEAGP